MMIDSQKASLKFSVQVLRQLMEQVSNPKTVCTLHVSDAPNEKVIYFVGGGVRLLSVGDRKGEDVESHLLRKGVIDFDTLHGILEQMRTHRKSLKQALIDKNLLTAEEFSKISNQLIRNELLDLVFWTDAYFTCYSGAPPQEIYKEDGDALVGSPNLSEAEDEVCDWAQQWERQKRLLHSDRASITITKKGLYGLEKQEGERKICLEGCLKGIELRSLWKATGVALPTLCDYLEEFLGKHWIEVERPKRDDSSEFRAREIEMLESCLGRVIGKDLVREKLIGLYIKGGMVEKAVTELKSLAESGLRNRQWLIAAERYKKILELQPENIETLEKLLKVYLDQQKDREATTLANTHVTQLLSQGKFAEAKAVGKVIRNLTGSKLAGDSILAAVSAGSGDVQNAVDQYLSISKEYEAEGKTKQAITILRQALHACPDNQRVVERLIQIDPEFAATQPQSQGNSREIEGKGRKKNGAHRQSAGPALFYALCSVLVIFTLHYTGILSFGGSSASAEMEGDSSHMTTEEKRRHQKRLLQKVADRGNAVLDYQAGPHSPGGQDFRATFGSLENPELTRGAYGDHESGSSSWAPPNESTQSSQLDVYGNSSSAWNSGNVYKPADRDDRPVMMSREYSAPYEPPPTRRRTPDRAPQPLLETLDDSPEYEISPVLQTGFEDLQFRTYQFAKEWEFDPRLSNLVKPRVLEKARRFIHGGKDDGSVRTRLLDRELLVAYKDSGPCAVVNARTGKKRFIIPPKHGHTWSFSHLGRRICRWKAGKPLLIINTRARRPTQTTTSWILQEDARSLAIGLEVIAVLRGRSTYLYSHKGRKLKKSELPAWNEATFVDELLILRRHRVRAEELEGIWVLHWRTWIPLWTCTKHEGHFEVR